MKAFLDDHQIVSAWVPIDICAPGGVATTSDYVCLKNWEKCLIVLFKAAGTAGDDPTITLDQATAVAGTDTKTLACITKSWIKTGAALNAIGAFTAAAQPAAPPGDSPSTRPRRSNRSRSARSRRTAASRMQTTIPTCLRSCRHAASTPRRSRGEASSI